MHHASSAKEDSYWKKTFCCRFRLDDSHRFEVAGRGHVCDGGSERPVLLKLAARFFGALRGAR